MIHLKAIVTGEGTTVRIRHNKWNREHGVRCQGALSSQDSRAWAGDEGVITRGVIHGKDWSQAVIFVEFSRGRKIHLAEMVNDAGDSVASGGDWRLTYGAEVDEFIKVKKPATVTYEGAS